MVTKPPTKPEDAMNHFKLNFNLHPEYISDISPETAVTEIKYAACQNHPSNSNLRVPNFRIHHLRTCYIDPSGNVISIIPDFHLESSDPDSTEEELDAIPDPEPTDKELYDILLNLAKQLIKTDLYESGISAEELESMWWDDSGKIEDFWARMMIKHFRFSELDLIPDYASTLYKLAKPVLQPIQPVLEGSVGITTLGDFLFREGFKAGEYHDVSDLLPSLKKFFKVDAWPTFVGHGGHHPSLFEVGVMTTKDCSTRMDHPMVNRVPHGKFLMRHL